MSRLGGILSSNCEIGFWIKFALNPHLATLCAGRSLEGGAGGGGRALGGEAAERMGGEAAPGQGH